MKKKAVDEDPLDREIDFSDARPNPYFVAAVGARYIRVIDEDLVDVFPDSESVNEALRTLVRLTADVPRRVSAKTVAAAKASRKKAQS
jgi:hypothetical protein